jgi:hypothetical protein
MTNAPLTGGCQVRRGALPRGGGIPGLPMRAPGEAPASEYFKARVVSRQHPDHDTEAWPHAA